MISNMKHDFVERGAVMSYRALYRVFRPQTFSEVRGQDHISTTLKNAILNAITNSKINKRDNIYYMLGKVEDNLSKINDVFLSLSTSKFSKKLSTFFAYSSVKSSSNFFIFV